MDPSKVTSKTSSLKALLLRAWRERWSDLQWGIHIKTILPRGVSGDVYNLADCILQQALVGPGPNHLVLSYLKHSLSSQLVSYAAVLQRISKYDGFHKPHCIISLLEFLESILPGITCRFKPEEEMIAGSVLSLAHWLLQCYHHHSHSHSSANMTDNTELLTKPASLLDHMLRRDFTTAMLYLAKHEQKDLYLQVVNKCQVMEAAVNQSPGLAGALTIKHVLLKLCSLELAGTGLEVDRGVEPLTYCLQPVLAVQVLLSPSCDSQVLVNQLLMIQRIKGYSNVRLYSELIRACFIILYDVLDTSKESQWGAFTFLKVPHILNQLHNSNLPRGVKLDEFSQDVVDSLDLVLQFTPLLDTMDARCACNNLECFLGELAKLSLVSDEHVIHYTAKREAAIAKLHKMEAASSGMPITKVIIRAEPTLSRVLQSLDAEFPKESLLGMLCQVFTGKSFELILAVATVEGKLCTLVSKLINLNECCKQGIDEGNKTLAMLFDITFLMLCYITQTFGSEVVLSDEGKGDSFMKQWVRECLVERGKPKSPDNMLQHCDPNIVEALLTQFTSTDSDFKLNGMTWHQVCFNMPGAIREVLVAWEQEALSVTDVKRILDAMQAPMCCLPVCAATWLCSYMQVSPQDALLKPINMVQQFLKVLTNEEHGKQNNYNERAALMVQIIRKMQFDVHTPTLAKIKAMGLSHSIISKQPVSEQLESVWLSVLRQGWVDVEATHTLESLYNTGGPQWFVTNLVKEMMKLRYKDELDRAVDLLMGIFHLDIESCTLCLLQQVLPQYLHNRPQSEELVEPQSSSLAKLCAYCIFATSIFSGSDNSSSRKRSRSHLETEDLDELCPASKILRLDSSLVFLSCGTSESSSPPLQEPLASALREVFKALSVITERTAHVSQQTHFVFRFLEYVVRCGKDRARAVLQGMPNMLVPCLVRALPDLFTTDLILRLYDMSTKTGRLATARDLCLLRNMTMKTPA